MSIDLRCERCRRLYMVDQAKAGTTIYCKVCGNAMEVPAGSIANSIPLPPPLPFSSQPPKLPPRVTTPPPAPVPARGLNTTAATNGLTNNARFVAPLPMPGNSAQEQDGNSWMTPGKIAAMAGGLLVLALLIVLAIRVASPAPVPLAPPALMVKETHDRVEVYHSEVRHDMTVGPPVKPAPMNPMQPIPSAFAPATLQPRPAAPVVRTIAAPAPPTPAGPWVSLLAHVDVAKQGLAGSWSMEGSSLVGTNSKGFAKFTFSAPPAPNYELEITFNRRTGHKEFCILLPAGKTEQISLGGMTGQSSEIQGGPKTNGAPGTYIINNKDQVLRLIVRPYADQVAIDIYLDGQPYLSWAGPQQRLGYHETCALDNPDAIGLAIHSSDIMAFKDVRIRPLVGPAN